MKAQPQLNELDRKHLGEFLDVVLLRHGTGTLTSGTAKGALPALLNAMDRGDVREVRCWIEEGRAHAVSEP